MKINNLLYFLLFAALMTTYSCSTDDEAEIKVPNVDMMGDDDDDNDENDLGDAPTFSIMTTNEETIVSE
ncbi:MAG: hypothetical protein ACI9FN_001117, partial [Saprospiraceae bacterium]